MFKCGENKTVRTRPKVEKKGTKEFSSKKNRRLYFFEFKWVFFWQKEEGEKKNRRARRWKC